MSDETEKQAEEPAEKIETEVTDPAPAVESGSEVETKEEDSPVAEETPAVSEKSEASAETEVPAEEEKSEPAEEVSKPETEEVPAAEEKAPAAEEEAPAAEAAAKEETPAVPEAKAAESAKPAEEGKSDLLRQAEKRLGEMEEKESGPELIEKVVHINRCAKVVKGGRRFSFSALVVCGDQQGRVGYGFGKANGVAECIQKASESSKTSMVKVNLNGTTIPHEVIGEFGGGKVLLRPASPGTGIIAGGGVRAVIEASGIKDVLAKSLGSNNHFNVVKATLDALQGLRTREQIYRLRGKKIRDKASI